MQVQEEGRFKARPIGWGVRESQQQGSQSVAISFQFALLERLDGEPKDCRDEQLEARGDVWIIRRDGQPMEHNVKDCRRALTWTGGFEQLDIPPGEDGACIPVEVTITIKAEEYNGRVFYKVDSIGERGGLPPRLAGDAAKKRAERLNALLGDTADAGNVPF